MNGTPASENTKQLVKRLKEEDMKAFDILYRQYSERLYSFAFSILKNREDAKEIVQDTFLKLWNKRKEIQPNQSLNAYLFTISHNISIDLIRKRLKDEKYAEYLKTHVTKEGTETENLFHFNELTYKLQEAIQQLPKQRKLIFQMSREEGLSHAEIAKKLNISVKTVENQINLSLKSIRRKLNSGELKSFLFTSLFI
ncbi:RNA polymerase sigma factor [Gaoshiqia sediminis]|uniref:RNA polymerase sigma-70 factor n=1 Tax=Gaoshiqia sediminis TaxID=2986998 RepID=A0AA42C7W0_9BACT|nr:RNA polymerase sigma-70 factor [Gaoshiqia sediminis]MCW0482041.1 RNA polymerase sigma-70 factor [Gaoshiqia sediminis]